MNIWYIQTFRFSDTITEHMLVICSLNKWGNRFDMDESVSASRAKKTIDRNYNQLYELRHQKKWIDISIQITCGRMQTIYTRLKHKRKTNIFIQCLLLFHVMALVNASHKTALKHELHTQRHTYGNDFNTIEILQ